MAVDKRSMYDRHEGYICYYENLANVFESTNSDTDDIVFIQSYGNGIVIRDFWNYYYVITDVSIEDVIDDDTLNENLLLVGHNLLVNMRFIDTINSNLIQIGSHIFPTDEKISNNLSRYQIMTGHVKLRHEKKEKEKAEVYNPLDDDEDFENGVNSFPGHGYAGPMSHYD